MQIARINLWSAMTTLATKDDAGIAVEAKDVVGLASKAGGFGNELSLEVNEFGVWTVRIFSCDDSDNAVELSVSDSGHLSVKRTKTFDGIREEREVNF